MIYVKQPACDEGLGRGGGRGGGGRGGHFGGRGRGGRTVFIGGNTGWGWGWPGWGYNTVQQVYVQVPTPACVRSPDPLPNTCIAPNRWQWQADGKTLCCRP